MQLQIVIQKQSCCWE